MATEFSRTLSLLRKERGVSQRVAAADLGVSQALLSHYENGIREPGLAFVSKVCDYYHVSADYMLGRTLARDGSMLTAEEILNAAEPGNVLQGSVLATLRGKLITSASGVLFGSAGFKLLSSKDAKKAYTHATAAALRVKESVMETVTSVQENAADILASAKEINEQRAKAEEAASVECSEA